MSITVRDNSIVIDKVKLITGTSHDEKTSEDCTSYNRRSLCRKCNLWTIIGMGNSNMGHSMEGHGMWDSEE